MTQEEKAKAYDEALEQAIKELKQDLHESGIWAIQRIFPQLRKEEKPLTPFQQCLNCILRGVYYAEVPDEKVNEFILNVVRTRTDELIKLAKKQEEQKHPDGCFTCDEYKKGYEAGRLNGFTAGYNKAMKEVEQKEQKPWKVGANAYFTPEQKPEEVDESTKRLNDNWMKQHFDDYEEQKPAWSEEDKRAIDRACVALRAYSNGDLPEFLPSELLGYADRLQSLRPQPKQEWSEEDERIIDTIVSVLSQYMDYKAVSDTGSGSAFATPRYSKEIDWLNSLRPSWKPSGEQMMALRRAINKLSNSDTADSVRLSIMHDNLKKLM